MATDATRTETPLFERGSESHRLGALVRGAARGQGGVAIVEGPAGIGKSALIDAASAEETETGLRALTARGSALETTHSFGVALQLLRPIVPESDDDLFAGAAAVARPGHG